MQAFLSIPLFKSFPRSESAHFSHVSYFASKLLRPTNQQNLKQGINTINMTPPAKIMAPENPMVGR
jgi:hypothetical protein